MRPTFAEIDLNAIAANLRELRRRVEPAKVMAVVKANAYGHGVEEVAQVACENGASYLGVALMEEGLSLRSLDLDLPILVFGGFFKNEIDELLENQLDVTVFDLERAHALSNRALEINQRARVHVKVDTGMGRVGVPWDGAAGFVRRVADLPNVEITGLYTHLAESEDADTSYSELQLSRFEQVVAELAESRVFIPIKHTANSGAVLNLPASYFDMVRIGLAMYGYYPARTLMKNAALKPAMAIKSKVMALKEVPRETFISYNRTHITGDRTDIATVPIGYGDGYSRLLSNQAEVLIRGTKYPIVGRICMDQIMVELGLKSAVEVGDEVVLLGRQGGQEISIYEICERMNTIPYEVTCLMTDRMPRVYLN